MWAADFNVIGNGSQGRKTSDAEIPQLFRRALLRLGAERSRPIFTEIYWRAKKWANPRVWRQLPTILSAMLCLFSARNDHHHRRPRQGSRVPAKKREKPAEHRQERKSNKPPSPQNHNQHDPPCVSASTMISAWCGIDLPAGKGNLRLYSAEAPR